MRFSSNAFRSLFAAAMILIVTPALTLAEGSSLSPFEAPVVSAASFAEAISGSLKETSRVTVINPVNQVTIGAQIQTLGNVTFRFNREWHVPDVSYADNGFAMTLLPRDAVHLQGTVELRALTSSGARQKVSVPAAATIFNVQGSTPSIQITFLVGIDSHSPHYYEVKGALKNQFTPEKMKVRRISSEAFSGKTCGVSLNSQPIVKRFKTSSLFASGAANTTSTYLSFDLATEADYEWYARYGSGSNSKIQAILNKVQTIYQDQLSLTFNLTKQVVVTTNGARYPSSNVDTLLTSFRNYGEANHHLGSADIFHLFTGKDTYLIDNGSQNNSVIGLAYLGVVCAYPTYAYGLTEDLDDALNHITTAHEMGHNFNAEHDAAGSIMGTTLNLNNPPTQFSTASRNQIGSWVNANSSCLDASDGTPTPGGGSGSDPGSGDTSHVSIGVSLKSNGNFTLSTGFSEIESGCSAQVHAGSTAGRAYSGTVIASPPTDTLSSTYRNIKIPRKTARYIANSQRVQRVYFGVVKTCPSATYYSVTRSVSPYKVTSSKPALKVGKWITTLAQKAALVSPG